MPALQIADKHLTLIVFAFEVPLHVLVTLSPDERYFAIGPQDTDSETAVTWSTTALQRQEALALALATWLTSPASSAPWRPQSKWRLRVASARTETVP